MLALLFLFYNPTIEGFDYYFYPPVNCIDNAFGEKRCFDKIGFPDYPWNAPYWSGYVSNYYRNNYEKSKRGTIYD